MLFVAICIEEEEIQNEVKMFLCMFSVKSNISIEIHIYSSGKKLENKILLGVKYDLIYLDISMVDADEIATAKKIRKMDEDVLLIYIIKNDLFDLELFRLNAFSIIKCPIKEQDFMNEFLKAKEKISNKKCYFIFRYKQEEFKVICHEILYFESVGRQIIIHLVDGIDKHFNGKLSEVEIKLRGGKVPFIRIHQSYLINYFWISSRSKTAVTIANQISLPISEERRQRFNFEYKKLLE